jgi:hypothetical protein
VPRKRVTEADRDKRLAERQEAASDASATAEGLGVPTDSENALEELLVALRAGWVDHGAPGSEARKLTLALAERTVCWIAEGMATGDALRTLAVSRDTRSRWSKLAADGVEPYRSFYEAMLRAEGLAELGYLRVVKRHAIDDPKLALRMLEILNPERYVAQPNASASNTRPQFSGATVTGAKALPPLAEYEETMG